MTHPQDTEILRPALRGAEAELARRLDEACAMRDVHDETTGELMRLEETLLEAARAAKFAVSVRRRLRASRPAVAPDGDGEAGAAEAVPDAAPGETPDGSPEAAAKGALAEGEHDLPDSSASPTWPGDSSVRNFVDRDGVEWQAWQVTPSDAAGSRALSFLEDYRDGWLAFESLDGARRKRLPHCPDDWARLPDAELERLLDRAVEARRKPRTTGDNGGQPHA